MDFRSIHSVTITFVKQKNGDKRGRLDDAPNK